MNRKQFAVVEVWGREIVVRVDGRSGFGLRMSAMESSDGSKVAFALNEDGTVMLDGKMDEMDFCSGS
jgi:hypothetical protein